MTIDFTDRNDQWLAELQVAGIAMDKERILLKAEELVKLHSCEILAWYLGTKIAECHPARGDQ